MSNDITNTLIKGGFIPGTVLAEMQRWGGNVPSTIPVSQEVIPPEELTEQLEEAFSSKSLLKTRLTDLDAWGKFNTNKVKAKLFLPSMSSNHVTKTDVDVNMEATENPEFEIEVAPLDEGTLIPWNEESQLNEIADLLLSQGALLSYEGTTYKISSVSSLYTGQHLAFISCQVEAA